MVKPEPFPSGAQFHEADTPRIASALFFQSGHGLAACYFGMIPAWRPSFWNLSKAEQHGP
jgi:hypothetical protein